MAGPRLPLLTPGGPQRIGPRQRALNGPRLGRLGTHSSEPNNLVQLAVVGRIISWEPTVMGRTIFQLAQERTAAIAFGTAKNVL